MEYAWVGRTNWIYDKVFELPPDMRKFERIILNFEGVDSVADVLLNEHLVGSTDNMFTRYRFDITDQISWKKQPNRLVVAFEAPVAYAQKKYEEHKSNYYIVPPECVPENYNGECHANFIRY